MRFFNVPGPLNDTNRFPSSRTIEMTINLGDYCEKSWGQVQAAKTAV